MTIRLRVRTFCFFILLLAVVAAAAAAYLDEHPAASKVEKERETRRWSK
jgi:hypothetical protein